MRNDELEEKMMKADDAKSVLTNPGFQLAIESLRSRYVDRLRSLPIGDLTVTSIHAKLVSLEEVINELKSTIDDFKLASRRQL